MSPNGILVKIVGSTAGFTTVVINDSNVVELILPGIIRGSAAVLSHLLASGLGRLQLGCGTIQILHHCSHYFRAATLR
jgi:hypothetical protein